MLAGLVSVVCVAGTLAAMRFCRTATFPAVKLAQIAATATQNHLKASGLASGVIAGPLINWPIRVVR